MFLNHMTIGRRVASGFLLAIALLIGLTLVSVLAVGAGVNPPLFAGEVAVLH